MATLIDLIKNIINPDSGTSTTAPESTTDTTYVAVTVPVTPTVESSGADIEVTTSVVSADPIYNTTTITPVPMPTTTKAESPDSIDKLPPTPIQIEYNIKLTVSSMPLPDDLVYTISLEIYPAIPVFGTGNVRKTSTLTSTPIPLPFKEAFMQRISELLSGKVEGYYDNDRSLKTLLNFGTDYQTLLTNWKYDVSDLTGHSMIVKLYKPLPATIKEKARVYISREISYPTLDRLYVIEAPALPPNVYLRPANKKISLTGQYGHQVNNVTYQNLFSSGAFDAIQPSDPLVEQWFTTALEGAELVVDYSNFKNFVFYGSAQKRLDAFKNKLSLIESYDATVSLNYGALGALYISSSTYNSVYAIAQKKQDIIRSFDAYERFLYYESGSAMSGSFTDEHSTDDDDIFYYLDDVTWPKIGGVVAPIASASTWYNDVSEVATAYDLWNVNRFVNNLPTYIADDPNSEPYMRFFDLVGHMFDTIKLYVDHMSDIYLRNSDTTEGASLDIIWDIAKAFGINLPNEYAIDELYDYAIGSNEKVYRQTASETWKRILHNHIFLLKTKGTRTSIRALLNAYGINPISLQVRETSAPSYFYTSQSYENYDEQTVALNLSSSYVRFPWSQSLAANNQPVSMQLRFSLSSSANTAVLLSSTTNTWGIKAMPVTASISGSYSHIEILNGTTAVITHPDFLVGEENFYSLMLTKDTSDSKIYSYFKNVDQYGEIQIDDVQSTSIFTPWNLTSNVDLGGSGSYYGTSMIGLVDEFRIWGERISEATFDKWVQYPGLYNGNDFDSAQKYLWARLSFNSPSNLGTASVSDRIIYNESPYQWSGSAPVNMVAFTASGFIDSPTYPYNYTIYDRTVTRETPNVGATQYDTNKIVIADSPTLKYFSGSAVPILSKDSSIVSLSDKINEYKKANNSVGFYFSTTTAINDSIIRSVGNINFQDYVSDPRYINSSSYPELDTLNKFYWDNYAYTYDQNRFIDYVKNLMGPVFKQISNSILAPARTKFLTGIVIEPHILERNRHPLKPIQRVDDDILNLKTSQSLQNTTTVSGDYSNYIGVVPLGEETIVEGAFTDFTARLEKTVDYDLNAQRDNYFAYITYSNQYNLAATYNALNGAIDVPSATVVAGEITDHSAVYNIYYDIFRRVRLKANEELVTAYYTPTYGSMCDLNSLASTNYFDDPNGLVGVESYTYIRTLQPILTSKGFWATSSLYHRYDMVSQSIGLSTTSTGSVYQEFYAVKDNFISNYPPTQDQESWRPVTYTPILQPVIRQALLLNGNLTIAPVGASGSIVRGYLPQHYRYFRPRYTAFKRSRYSGCVQDQDSTTDGKSPVEVFVSSGERLVVTSNVQPVQRTDNTTGPRLDVK